MRTRTRVLSCLGLRLVDGLAEVVSLPETDCALARIDPLLLAWAAGFFDGEGSTIVHESKPGYLRLTVAVPQRGGADAPEVLFRFREAVLGLGEVIPAPQTGDGMWAWRSRSGEEGQAVIALLWSEIGSIKRTQATLALSRLHDQYRTGRFKPRPPRRTRRPHAEHYGVTAFIPSAERTDHAWAAGFLDGEGHFGLPRAAARNNAPDWHRIRASATQNGAPGEPPEVLHKLQRLLGGKIERHGEPDDFRWRTEGVARVEEVLVKVRPWLGTVKQRQARLAVEAFRAQVRVHGDSERCVRGHAYDHVYMSPKGPKRRCSACARIVGRMGRARRGIGPGHFRNGARRYTF